MLTDTVRIESVAVISATVQQIMTREFQRQAEEEMIRTMSRQQVETATKFMNQQLAVNRLWLSIVRGEIQVPLPQERRLLSQMLMPLEEEEELFTKRLITVRQKTEQQLTRRHLTRLEKWLTEIRQRPLSPTAINLIDHTVLCELDKLLWETNPTTVTQITQQLVEMCEKKTSRLQPIQGQEAVQKHLLQLYVPMFMTFPFTLNMMALRLSMLTRQAMLGKSMTLYYMGATQAQAIKQKHQLACCEQRRLETKQVSSGKPSSDAIPEKFSVGYTHALTEEEKVGLIKDIRGSELPFMALRYAYSIPYWLRRFVAIHMGMPENSRYALYFGIGGLPTRRSTWRYDFMKYPEAKYLQYSADQHIMKLIRKIQIRRGHYIKRYGKYYKRRRV
jgi:hypothetical protein